MTGMLYLMNSTNIAENLESITLDNSKISEHVLGLLVLQIKNKPLSSLSLRGNNFGEGAAPIIYCLLDMENSPSTSSPLRRLDLSSNNLNVVYRYTLMRLLIYLNFQKHLHIFAPLLARNSTLTFLSLSDNGPVDLHNLKYITDALVFI